jgi:hypothetical protein
MAFLSVFVLKNHKIYYSKDGFPLFIHMAKKASQNITVRKYSNFQETILIIPINKTRKSLYSKELAISVICNKKKQAENVIKIYTRMNLYRH